MKAVYNFRARQDLLDIYNYIAFTLLAPDAARNTTERILEAVRGLQSMPEKNPLYKGEPWHSLGVRSFRTASFSTRSTQTQIRFPLPASCMEQETSPASLKKPPNGNSLILNQADREICPPKVILHKAFTLEQDFVFKPSIGIHEC